MITILDPANMGVYGENLALYKSITPTTIISTEYALNGWVENELDEPWPINVHLTQVLWRPTDVVGCAEASKPMDDGGTCHYAVCRYAKPGNCNMNNYMDNSDDWWMTPMLMDDSICAPMCHPDDC